MSRISLSSLAHLTLLASVIPGSAAAQDALGVVVDRGRAASSPLGGREPYVHTFDPVTMLITGSVMLPTAPFANVFDVEIAPDLSACYVGDNGTDELWIVDLTTQPPSLASGTNPLQLSGGNLDLALSPSGHFLACGGGEAVGIGGTNIAIVDLRSRVQTDVISFAAGAGTSPVALTFAPDGSLVVNEQTFTSPSQHEARLRRFRIDASGLAQDTGDVLEAGVIPGSQDLLVPSYPFLPRFLDALLARHTVAVSRSAAGALTSVRTRGLTPVETETLDFPTGIDLDFDPWRSILYVRTIESPQSGPAGPGNSRIDGYRFCPLSGGIGPRVVQVALDRRAGTAYGVEQTALDPVSRRLFVSGLASGEVRVYDSVSGAQVGTITDPNLLFGLGISVRRR